MIPTVDSERLEKIDKLYQLRLDRQINLPQLIVAGDQSSGKSSVLEALTNGLPFPRDSGLCTRFPTQIVFKRSPVLKVEISVIPAGGTISSFKKKELPSLSNQQFLDIISEACTSMGLPKPGESKGSLQSFSFDMLKIELSGPQHEHFSVIDLPGLFRKPTPGSTTTDDIRLVREMISSFIKNPRSIILAVVPANVDIATQEIIHMAEEADPGGKRTLGVLTKPDLVDAGAEDKVLSLLQPQSSQLGYTIVCNRSQSALNSNTEERNAHEMAFFNKEPWSDAPRDRVGISAVKNLFDSLLKDITRINFNKVIKDIDTKLQKHLQEMEKIGPARQDPATQRMYLLQLTAEFQSLVGSAIQSLYGNSPCFENKQMRLASLVISSSEHFSDRMMKRSYTRSFSRDGKALHIPQELQNIDTDEESSEEPDVSDSSEKEEHSTTSKASGDDYVVDFEVDGEDESAFPELLSLTSSIAIKAKFSDESILSWIKGEFHGHRSLGIGGLSPALYQTLFRTQTAPWVEAARDHVAAIIRIIHRFSSKLLNHICKDPTTIKEIWSKVVPQLMLRYQSALQHVDFLLRVERDGSLGTLNHYFAENIRKTQESRALERLKALNVSRDSTDSGSQLLLRLTDVTKAYQSNEDHDIEDIHDTLKSYCKVARKRFVDNVYMQVIDHLLITCDTSPLKILCPAWVGQLSDDELAIIAGEKESIRQRRNLLLEEMASFREGLAILRA